MIAVDRVPGRDVEFDADLTAELLHRHRVFHLLSPEVWPRYNGAIEAGIGTGT
jgi:hypothetical protein